MTLDITSADTFVGSLKKLDDFSFVSASCRECSSGKRKEIDDVRFLALEIGTSSRSLSSEARVPLTSQQ